MYENSDASPIASPVHALARWRRIAGARRGV